MYSIKENIFIVWGGNEPLAQKLQKRLTSKKLRAHVGGNAESQNSNYYLGPRVLDQMNKATQAIILAKPENFGDKGKKNFRENLMFEWGFLLGRLAPQDIFVYLIDCNRSDLPSDLHGAYTFVVESVETTEELSKSEQQKEDTRHAKVICDDFQKSSKQWDKPTAFGVLADWPKWRRFIVDQIQDRMAPQPYTLRKVLRFSFIPVSYFGTRISEMRDILSKIDVVGEENLQDIVALQGILDYLNLARQNRDFNAGEFDAIKRSFSFLANSEDAEITIMTRYAMGLCLMSESFHPSYSAEKKQTLLGYAHSNFSVAYELVVGQADWKKMGIKKINLDNESKLLWSAFLASNIGKILYLLGKIEESKNFYKISVENRISLQQHLSVKNNEKILSLFSAETNIHRIRYMKVSNKLDNNSLDEIESDFYLKKPDIPHQYRMLKREIDSAKDQLSYGPSLF